MIETSTFNEGVENMPKYFTEWNIKGRNFKIWEQSLYDHLEATSVSTTSQVYYYIEHLNRMFDSLYSNKYRVIYKWKYSKLNTFLAFSENYNWFYIY